MCGSCGKGGPVNRGGFGKFKSGQKVKGLRVRKRTFEQLKAEIEQRVEKKNEN